VRHPSRRTAVVQVVGAALSDNVKEIERLLIAAGEPLIFQRRRGLVSTIRLPEAKTIGGDQAGGRLADDSLILHGRHAAPDGPVRAVGRQVEKMGGERTRPRTMPRCFWRVAAIGVFRSCTRYRDADLAR
jgi:hypothetical protein